MSLRFIDKDRFTKITFESLNSGTIIDVDDIAFRKQSEKHIDDIMNKGLSEENKDLVLDNITLPIDNYKKLSNDKYKVILRTLIHMEDNYLRVCDVTLAKIELNFDPRHIEIKNNQVIIGLSNMRAYKAHGYSIELLEE